MEILTPGTGLMLYSLISLVVMIILYFLLLRWAFRTNTMVKLQRQQVEILKAIAIKQGVDQTVINTIVDRP